MVRDAIGLPLSSWSGAAAAAVLALLMPVVGAAQRTEGMRPRSLEASSFKITSLPAGTTLRVATISRQRLEGRLWTASDTTLTLGGARFGQSFRTVRLAEVDTVWERGNAAGAGAVVGLLLGGVGVALLACQQTCDESGVIPGALVTAALGAGLGAMLGSASTRWHRRFP